jgi:hypothetical protein
MQGQIYYKYYFKINNFFYKIHLIYIKYKKLLKKSNTNKTFKKKKPLFRNGMQNTWPTSWDWDKLL